MEKENRLPNALVACIGGGSNALGLFHPFLDDKEVEIFGVEAAGKGLKTKDFWANLRRSIESGLTPEQALNALTMSPAQQLGVDDKLGSLAKGKLAMNSK